MTAGTCWNVVERTPWSSPNATAVRSGTHYTLGCHAHKDFGQAMADIGYWPPSPSAAPNSVVALAAVGQGAAMAAFVSHTTIDCTNAYELSEWWKPVLGYVDIEDDPNEPGHEECMIRDPGSGHQVLFIEVPDPTPGKPRIHFDLRPRERHRDEEVAWLQEYGAAEVADHRGIHGPGSGWVTFADPEGNLFCILRSEAELATTS